MNDFELTVPNLYMNCAKPTTLRFMIQVDPSLMQGSTRPGKPGNPEKMKVYLENLELTWNFVKFNKNHVKMI